MRTRPSSFGPGDLTEVWGAALRAAVLAPRGELGPASISIDRFTATGPAEDSGFRQFLDLYLNAHHSGVVRTVANTIFPSRMAVGRTASELFGRYGTLYDRRLKRYPQNRYGTYFLRLIRHPTNGNQLEWLIDALNKRLSRPLSIPLSSKEDLTHAARRGFPCLQQVSVRRADSGLHIAGYYTMQYLYSRAYGNMVGLSALGLFLQSETGVELKSVTCTAQTLTLDLSKAQSQDLVDALP